MVVVVAVVVVVVAVAGGVVAAVAVVVAVAIVVVVAVDVAVAVAGGCGGCDGCGCGGCGCGGCGEPDAPDAASVKCVKCEVHVVAADSHQPPSWSIHAKLTRRRGMAQMRRGWQQAVVTINEVCGSCRDAAAEMLNGSRSSGRGSGRESCGQEASSI